MSELNSGFAGQGLGDMKVVPRPPLAQVAEGALAWIKQNHPTLTVSERLAVVGLATQYTQKEQNEWLASVRFKLAELLTVVDGMEPLT